jgi:hypothetical protein
MNHEGSPYDPIVPRIMLRNDVLSPEEEIELLSIVRSDLNPLLDSITLDSISMAEMPTNVHDSRLMWPCFPSSQLCQKEWQLKEDEPEFTDRDGAQLAELSRLQGFFLSEATIEVKRGDDSVKALNFTLYGLARNGQWVIAKAEPITEFAQDVPPGTRCFKVKRVEVLFCTDAQFIEHLRKLKPNRRFPLGWTLSRIVDQLHHKVSEKIPKWRASIEAAEKILPRLSISRHTLLHCFPDK